jgi:adenylate cyclase
VEALELVRHCEALAPSLSKYYRKVLRKAAALPE